MSLQERAWNSVCPLVIKLKTFYSFSLRLGDPTLIPHCHTLSHERVFSQPNRTILVLWNALCYAEEALKSLLKSLTCPPLTPTQHLEREQALAKQFAEILHFTLRFDELKVHYTHRPTHSHPHIKAPCVLTEDCFNVLTQMRIPAIQNDFSYYRRTISRNRIKNMNVRRLFSWSLNTHTKKKHFTLLIVCFHS